MKVLTISQPYASLIASGQKWVENRRWACKYRGPLVIHAGKGQQYMSYDEMWRHDPPLPIGSVVAVCQLVDCVNLLRLKAMRSDYPVGSRAAASVVAHEHAEGPFLWVLEDVVKLADPIPVRGSQGLWNPKPELLSKLQERPALARFLKESS